MRNKRRMRLRTAAGMALVGALAVAGSIAVPSGHEPAAQARESGSGGISGSTVTGGGSGSITERMPSGVNVTISQPQILLSGYQGRLYPQTGRSNPSDSAWGGLRSGWTNPDNAHYGLIWAQPTVWNLSLPYNSPGTEGITLPQSYFNNNRHYDVMRFTVSLDPPVVNPQFNMVMFGWIVGWGANEWVSKPFGKLTLTGATNANGSSIPVSMSRAAGWDYGGFRFVFKNGGQSMEDGTPDADLNKHYITGNNYSGGTTQFNSNGVPVSSMTFVSSDAWANRGGLRTAYCENWGFQLNMPQSVSALPRLAPGTQYGHATHAITDPGVRLGASVVEGNRTRYVQTADSGTAGDNSDAGMDALRGRSMPTASAGGTYTIDNIPLSNTSNRQLGLMGWIDFNGNGRFDPDEASALATVSPGQTFGSLSWQTPATVATSGRQALRLRLGPIDQIQGRSSGMAAMGEVEDYASFIPTEAGADLQVVKTTATSTIEPGGQITYHLDVTNRSPRTIANVMVSDAIPSQITTYTATGTNGYLYDGSRNMSWMVGSLPAGGSARVTITGQVSATAMAGSTITNTATVTSPEGCLVPSACTSTVTDRIQTPVISDIAIVKTNSLSGANPTVQPGETFDYSITVTNNSGRTYNNVVIRDTLPANLIYVSGTGWTFSGQTGTTTIASLAPGERVTLTLRVRVAANAQGLLTNVSAIDSMATIAQCQANASLPGCGVDRNPPRAMPVPLRLYKTNDLSGNTVPAGTVFNYEVSVVNQSLVWARGIKVTDVLPSELEFVSTSQPGWDSISGQVAVSSLFDLAPGAEKLLYLRVRAVTATTDLITNMVMAEQTEASTFSRVSEAATASKIRSCVAGQTTGLCTADHDPFRIIDPIRPVNPVDPWGGGTSTALTGTVSSSTPAADRGTVFLTTLQLRNAGSSPQTVTVKAKAADGSSFIATAGWQVSGSVATLPGVRVNPGSTSSVSLVSLVGNSVQSNQQFPIVFTVDGTDPSQCTRTSASCFWDPNPPRTVR